MHSEFWPILALSVGELLANLTAEEDGVMVCVKFRFYTILSYSLMAKYENLYDFSDLKMKSDVPKTQR
jgi:hypothetical protein